MDFLPLIEFFLKRKDYAQIANLLAMVEKHHFSLSEKLEERIRNSLAIKDLCSEQGFASWAEVVSKEVKPINGSAEAGMMLVNQLSSMQGRIDDRERARYKKDNFDVPGVNQKGN